MRVSNADEVAKEIHDYKLEVERKLKGMVSMFAYAATRAIQAEIPIGDQASIDAGSYATSGPQKKYYDLYRIRNAELKISGESGIEVGLHRGALTYSETGSFQVPHTVVEEIAAAEAVQNSLDAQYTVGERFFIGAAGPAYDKLEAGSSTQAPDGISKPADQAIADIYRLDMKTYYDASR